MLTYYTYYSVGGYKDFMLGSNESNVEATYYFPLIPIFEERAKSDESIAHQVNELKRLPQIYQLSEQDRYGLPKSARPLFSHGGYKLIYKHLEDDKYVLAIRDIANNGSTDEVGRNIPFLFVILGDTKTDVNKLDILATYIASNMHTSEKFISSTICMDLEKNGLRFDVGKFTNWINQITGQFKSNIVPCKAGTIDVKGERDKVALMVLPRGISLEKAVMEQKITTTNIIYTMEENLIARDDTEKLIKELRDLAQQLKEERAKNAVIKKGMIVAGAGGFLLGALIAGCCK